MRNALQYAVHGGLAVWQVFIILAVLASPATGLTAALVITGHALLGLAFAVGALRRWPALPCVLVGFLLIIVDYAAASGPDSPLTLAAVWTSILTSATPAIIVRTRLAIPVSATAVVVLTGAQVVLGPDWPASMRLMSLVAPITVFCGAHAVARLAGRTAHRADLQADRAQRARQHERLAQRTGAEIAEDARVLHDTIINTLGAVARGDAARSGSQIIRERCAQDAAVLTDFTRAGPHDPSGFGLAELQHRTGIAILTPASSDADLARFEALLPGKTARTIRLALAELVTNAAKHAAVDHVTVGATFQDATLVITVADSGAGFDGCVIPGRGLAESVLRRCALAGVTVSLRSEPGQGTSATLVAPLEDLVPPAPTPADTADRFDVTVIGRAGCWAWVAMILATDLVLSIVRSDALTTPAVASTVVIGALTLLSWFTCRNGGQLPAWLTVLVVAAVPGVFTVSLLATMRPGASLIELQAVLLTVPLFVLAVTRRTHRSLAVALLALGLTVAALSWAMHFASPELAFLPVIAVCPQLGLFAGVHTFLRVLGTVIDSHERQRLAALDAEGAIIAHAALTLSRERWVQAGARAAIILLEQIASGEADPLDADVQARCADEEEHLRQLLALDADLLNLSPRLALALVHARARRVPLRLRSGTLDAPDEVTAQTVGQALLAAIDACGPADVLSAGFFIENGRQVALLLGPPAIAAAIQRTAVPTPFDVGYESLPTQVLVTVRLRDPATRASPGRTGRRAPGIRPDLVGD